MGYYDVDEILAAGTKFSCKFNYDIPGLGYLEGNPGRQLNKNAKIELPLWLASVLAIVTGDQEHDDEEALPFVQFLSPEMFSSKVVNAIKSDAPTLDVHSISGQFYTLGIKWATLFSDVELAGVINKMLLERALEINRHASSVSVDAGVAPSDSTGTLLMTLDEFEKKLYKETHDTYRDAKLWLSRR
ncbi:DNA replication protein PSF3 Ecym_2006 [Eremothecium cymbalariae DBVPG|uniref:DNA replication complex GINS protein PSF3 n=1 Tax=Eremothecium cymbalariae (strain CBS 270.75 / DBVPG 7215 / KCTC 17166 / NRRL Y-17582) TaxID=931890 RepID=G8JNF6_ERECY|nr:Hypothetical protein Ecym_2006 [Eremothecium cymbalariae DBVPG\